MPKLPFKTLNELKAKDLKGRRVLVRVDFNVPIKDGQVLDNSRLLAALPTLNYLANFGAKVLVIAHLGQKGTETLVPVVRALEPHLKIGFSKNIFDEKRFATMSEGAITLSENIRCHKEEEKNDQSFAKHLASLADIYINDAFSVSHRSHASIVGVPKLLPSYAGLAFAREYKELTRVFRAPQPFILILGGAKFTTKLPVIKKLLSKADFVFIGGALAHSLWRKLGYEIGKSLVDDGIKGLAEILKDKKVHLPIDVVVKNKDGRKIKRPEDVRKQDNIQDAGPETVKLIAEAVAKAKFILWNGPLGNFEKGFGQGTKAVALAITKSKAYSVVGGGDTVAAIEEVHLAEDFSYLSTSGGAMLEFIAKGTLPGLEALKKQKN